MKITIVGAGNTGHALAAYLAQRGCTPVLATRSAEKSAAINENGITAEGAIQGNFRVPSTTSLAEAVQGAALVAVMTTANAHRAVARQLAPLLTDGQSILVFNSNWGAFEFAQVLGGDIAAKNLTVAETAAQLFVATSGGPGHVNVSVKEKISVAATDPAKTAPLLAAIGGVFPQFEEGGSIIETTISTTNPVIHVPISLANIARIENAQEFRFYGDGVSKAGVELILKIDEERVAVARALGCEIDDVLTVINSFWEKKHDNLFDALTKNETYLRAMGPKSLTHRYFTEDVPFGIAPVAQIGRLYGVETPYTDALLDILYKLAGQGLAGTGVSFRKEDFAPFVGAPPCAVKAGVR